MIKLVQRALRELYKRLQRAVQSGRNFPSSPTKPTKTAQPPAPERSGAGPQRTSQEPDPAGARKAVQDMMKDRDQQQAVRGLQKVKSIEHVPTARSGQLSPPANVGRPPARAEGLGRGRQPGRSRSPAPGRNTPDHGTTMPEPKPVDRGNARDVFSPEVQTQARQNIREKMMQGQRQPPSKSRTPSNEKGRDYER